MTRMNRILELHGASDLLNVLNEFCEAHMLQWLEVLSVLGAVDLRVCEGLKGVRNALQV